MISKNTLRLRALAGLLIAGSATLCAQTPAAQSAAPTAAKGPVPAATAAPRPPAASSSEAAIRAVLERQQFDWNRGDTDGFLLGYADDTVFISDTITRGLEKLRVRYQSHYPTRASMGKLTFSDIEIHMIDPNSAYVIGRFHLERTAEGGGESQGVYTLLFKKATKGWKIAFDHTT